MSKHHEHLLGWLSLLLVACSDDDAKRATDASTVDAASAFPDVDAGPAELPPERVVACDQAVDGTPCGDEPEHHCIFSVCSANLCGDGVRAGDEACDDGNDMDGDSCPATCQYGPVCRDGREDEGEECDDGNRIDDDSCSNDCLTIVCGNDRLDPGEECDDGNARDGDACSATCKKIACGNGRVDPGEHCDGLSGCDTEAGEACSADCGSCGLDRCGACERQKCADYSGIDVYGGCREAVDEESVGGTGGAGFIERCSALDDCIRRNPGCVGENGPIACYCGDLTPEMCQVNDQARGACAEHYAGATSCTVGEGFSNCVLDAFVNLTLPSGWSNYLAICRFTECKSECGY